MKNALKFLSFVCWIFLFITWLWIFFDYLWILGMVVIGIIIVATITTVNRKK